MIRVTLNKPASDDCADTAKTRHAKMIAEGRNRLLAIFNRKATGWQRLL